METGKDEQLLEKARRAEPQALASLCGEYYPKILKYMYYRVDDFSAEDLASEVFLRVLGKIQNQKGSFLAWLYRIAANVVVDYGRNKQRKRATQMSDCIHDNLIGKLSSNEVVDRQMDLHHAITKLTDEQREMVTLKFIQGLGNDEISEITGRKPNAIRVLQFRALSSLRDILNDEKVQS